eukprot:gnl/Carplike_NY0171/10292_a14489_116.p1 GENE.gnl/Carplike_NY0171/10292_a14489_116~~gnl/Carplike_NY0171/10292_a14489_116.p1  ORF type:complete len:358 (+),score=106.29 gnl/Carplike_NY0171/10292_a14489_116:1-1074(+)
MYNAVCIFSQLMDQVYAMTSSGRERKTRGSVDSAEHGREQQERMETGDESCCFRPNKTFIDIIGDNIYRFPHPLYEIEEERKKSDEERLLVPSTHSSVPFHEPPDTHRILLSSSTSVKHSFRKKATSCSIPIVSIGLATLELITCAFSHSLAYRHGRNTFVSLLTHTSFHLPAYTSCSFSYCVCISSMGVGTEFRLSGVCGVLGKWAVKTRGEFFVAKDVADIDPLQNNEDSEEDDDEGVWGSDSIVHLRDDVIEVILGKMKKKKQGNNSYDDLQRGKEERISISSRGQQTDGKEEEVEEEKEAMIIDTKTILRKKKELKVKKKQSKKGLSFGDDDLFLSQLKYRKKPKRHKKGKNG